MSQVNAHRVTVSLIEKDRFCFFLVNMKIYSKREQKTLTEL